MEALSNGGESDAYKWGQTLDSVTVQYKLEDGVRARDLKVDIGRSSLHVVLKRAGAPILVGTLAQPVLCDECTWMLDEGHLVLTLAKDNRRAENTGPSTEWWNGVFAGEDTLDAAAVSVSDYVQVNELPPEQRASVDADLCARENQRAYDQRRVVSEAALPESQRAALDNLRAAFPDIPIEYGDSQGAP